MDTDFKLLLKFVINMKSLNLWT